jgi:DNA-directed RNA polymerase specialized sigma24 family protein
MAAKKAEPLKLDSEKALGGVLALLAAEREERLDDNREPRKTEVVLAGAGLTNSEIAALIGKSPNAVGMAVSRAATAKKPRAKSRGRK